MTKLCSMVLAPGTRVTVFFFIFFPTAKAILVLPPTGDVTSALSVTVHLLADDVDTGLTKVLNASNEWHATFENLELHKAGGATIVYTVVEDEVPGYTTQITGSATAGYTVTNTHTIKTTSVEGKKTWADDNNRDGLRPNSITVQLKANGEDVAGKTATTTAADDWKYSFTDLPLNENGKAITYTVVETSVPTGYEASYSGMNVTITHAIGKVSVSGT